MYAFQHDYYISSVPFYVKKTQPYTNTAINTLNVYNIHAKYKS
jgi:hypothetical protein